MYYSKTIIFCAVTFSYCIASLVQHFCTNFFYIIKLAGLFTFMIIKCDEYFKFFILKMKRLAWFVACCSSMRSLIIFIILHQESELMINNNYIG